MNHFFSKQKVKSWNCDQPNKMSDNNSNAKGKEDTSYIGTALAVIGVVGAIAGLFSGVGSGPERMTMKAPGKDGRIFRDVFQSDPKAYFRNLRKKWIFEYVELIFPSFSYMLM